MKHFHHIIKDIDVDPLLAQIAEHPELWNLEPEFKGGTVLYGLDSIVLRVNRAPQVRDAMHVLTEAQKIVFMLMNAVQGIALGNVVISKLPAGHNIEPHVDRMPLGEDGTPMLPFYQRYQIPLDVPRGVLFRCEDESIDMRPGDCYWFNNQRTHSVENRSNRDRISMRCDVRPWEYATWAAKVRPDIQQPEFRNFLNQPSARDGLRK